jgi:hypothetical protein
MPAGNYDMLCEQGATFQRRFLWQDESEQPINLTGYTARMQVRTSVKSSESVVELTTENDAIVLYPDSGAIELVLSAEDTAELPAKQCVYDLEMVSTSGFVTRLLQGTFVISPEVTR